MPLRGLYTAFSHPQFAEAGSYPKDVADVAEVVAQFQDVGPTQKMLPSLCC